MWKVAKDSLVEGLSKAIADLYGVRHRPVVEIPPRRSMGDVAFPAPLHLAREVRKKPRDIAQEILEAWSLPDEARNVTVAGPGYLNVFLKRSLFASRALEASLISEPDPEVSKTIVEHTNINPNKAAHIGHLRNAVLGDILVRTLRRLGQSVEVQNYVDDTGVQVADVVVGLVDLEGKTVAQVSELPEPFDYTCWDLYSRVGQWYEEDPQRQELRRATLHELESGSGERAEMGRLVARRVLQRHLLTMGRLGVNYDLLTRESEILALDFFALAFERLKEAGAIHLEEAGKNEGCWVMPLSGSEEFAGLEDPDKVIVRSDGTVTYVGKDIAYQLWKFGLLGRDFRYLPWQDDPSLWETNSRAESPEPAAHPDFGAAQRVVNVIDIRQSYLQKIVRAGLEALGHQKEAGESVHFSYEMVSLSSSTARQLGFLSDEEGPGRTLEMSGRKGIGVKADDLLDALERKSREEIAARQRDLPEAELLALARQIATAAVRFFMVRSGTQRVIAFDLDEALSFEGESGPYLQYSVVRARNIRRKLDGAGLSSSVASEDVVELPDDNWSDDLWDLVLSACQVSETLEKAAKNLELSLLAHHALYLAQGFNAVYHKHPILHESDPEKRTVRLAATQVFARGLEELAGVLGIPLPDRM
jgi:arginyl-tRNA synthetase